MVGVTLHKNYINPSAEHQESSNFICDLRALMCLCRTGPSAAVRKDWGKPLALKGEGIVHFLPFSFSFSCSFTFSLLLSSFIYFVSLHSRFLCFSLHQFRFSSFPVSFPLFSPVSSSPVPFYSGMVKLRGSCVGLCCWAHFWLLGERQLCQLQEHSPFGGLAERLCKDWRAF